jgi:hypothetical protein
VAANREAVPGPSESLARGTLPQGFPRNLGDLLVSSWKRRAWPTRPQRTRPQAARGVPIRGANETLHRRGTGCQGRPEASGKGEEESYDLIVPVKVENREAGIHWRKGVNRRT